MQDKDKKKHIRFHGFTNEWEQCEFKEIFELLTNNTLSRAELNDKKGSVFNVHYGDVLVKFGEMIDLDVDRLPYISDVAKVAKSARLQNGDVIIADTAEDSTVGKCAEMTGVSDKSVVSGLHTIPCRPNKQFAPGYLGYFMNSSAYHNQLMPLMQGTKVTSVSKSALAYTLLSYPMDIEEQALIGRYFMKLNNLITLHQRKYAKLLDFKSSMLEKMFPKGGADVPEVRFKGFTGAWKVYSFKNITYPAGTRNRDNIQYESYSITNEAGFVPQDEQFENGGTMKDADKRMYIIVEPKSFAYNPARINIGSIGYQYLDHNVIVSSLYEVFKTTDECNDQFLWYWFKTKAFSKMIEQLQEGGVRLYFYYDKLCMCSLQMPDITEQARIAEYFKKLDALISAYSIELKKLQSLKKALLEKMFI